MDYGPKIVQQAEQFAAQNMSIRAMAGTWGVREETVSRWKVKHPEFLEALERGAAKLEQNLTVIVIRDATGVLKRNKQTGEVEKDAVGNPLYVVEPNPERALQILRRVSKKNWSEHSTIEITGKDGSPLIPDDRTKRTDQQLYDEAIALLEGAERAHDEGLAVLDQAGKAAADADSEGRAAADAVS